MADKGYGQDEDKIACFENGIIPNLILPDGKDEYELEVEYGEPDGLDPASTETWELKKCLHAGITLYCRLNTGEENEICNNTIYSKAVWEKRTGFAKI